MEAKHKTAIAMHENALLWLFSQGSALKPAAFYKGRKYFLFSFSCLLLFL